MSSIVNIFQKKGCFEMGNLSLCDKLQNEEFALQQK